MSYRRILNLVNLWATWRVVKKVFKVKVMNGFVWIWGRSSFIRPLMRFFISGPGKNGQFV